VICKVKGLFTQKMIFLSQYPKFEKLIFWVVRPILGLFL
jgi:hypothetical protein